MAAAVAACKGGGGGRPATTQAPIEHPHLGAIDHHCIINSFRSLDRWCILKAYSWRADWHYGAAATSSLIS